ncbi:hypothetical protein [Ktedonospora formicarum]|uniref:Uncharacterized protein n=1 Tax=Ktedonospora formicarum TaxID=2778364 RepID=A0A8J3MTT3_9CHLR|nr:hypothetical protein [Ktedonospora formicarum]GHO47485.1 hypothetical protein KSX_56480 [Ktedonospora formicarum]
MDGKYTLNMYTLHEQLNDEYAKLNDRRDELTRQLEELLEQLDAGSIKRTSDESWSLAKLRQVFKPSSTRTQEAWEKFYDMQREQQEITNSYVDLALKYDGLARRFSEKGRRPERALARQQRELRERHEVVDSKYEQFENRYHERIWGDV